MNIQKLLLQIRKKEKTFANIWYKSWLGLCGFDKSNLVPTSVSVGLVRLSSDSHDLIPPPLVAILKKQKNG